MSGMSRERLGAQPQITVEGQFDESAIMERNRQLANMYLQDLHGAVAPSAEGAIRLDYSSLPDADDQTVRIGLESANPAEVTVVVDVDGPIQQTYRYDGSMVTAADQEVTQLEATTALTRALFDATRRCIPGFQPSPEA